MKNTHYNSFNISDFQIEHTGFKNLIILKVFFMLNLRCEGMYGLQLGLYQQKRLWMSHICPNVSVFKIKALYNADEGVKTAGCFQRRVNKKIQVFFEVGLDPPTYSGKSFFSSNVFYFLPNSVRFVKKTFFHNFVPLKLKKILNFFLLFQFPSCGMSQTYSKLDTPPTLKVIFYIISG